MAWASSDVSVGVRGAGIRDHAMLRLLRKGNHRERGTSQAGPARSPASVTVPCPSAPAVLADGRGGVERGADGGVPGATAASAAREGRSLLDDAGAGRRVRPQRDAQRGDPLLLPKAQVGFTVLQSRVSLSPPPLHPSLSPPPPPLPVTSTPPPLPLTAPGLRLRTTQHSRTSQLSSRNRDA